MIRRPPRSTRTDTLFPSRRSSDLARAGFHPKRRFPMASLRTERVLSVNHWSDSLFSFKTTRERSEEHTSELQSLMRISYAVFCLKKKKKKVSRAKKKNTTSQIKKNK